jgi:hypothetical protein
MNVSDVLDKSQHKKKLGLFLAAFGTYSSAWSFELSTPDGKL